MPSNAKRHAKWSLLELHLDDAPDVRFVVDHEDVRAFSVNQGMRSHEGGDVGPVAPEVVQQRAEVRARVNNQEKDGVWGNGGDYGVTAFVFDHGGRE